MAAPEEGKAAPQGCTGRRGRSRVRPLPPSRERVYPEGSPGKDARLAPRVREEPHRPGRHHPQHVNRSHQRDQEREATNLPPDELDRSVTEEQPGSTARKKPSTMEWWQVARIGIRTERFVLPLPLLAARSEHQSHPGWRIFLAFNPQVGCRIRRTESVAASKLVLTHQYPLLFVRLRE